MKAKLQKYLERLRKEEKNLMQLAFDFAKDRNFGSAASYCDRANQCTLIRLDLEKLIEDSEKGE